MVFSIRSTLIPIFLTYEALIGFFTNHIRQPSRPFLILFVEIYISNNDICIKGLIFEFRPGPLRSQDRTCAYQSVQLPVPCM
jgi:hypothetical protein